MNGIYIAHTADRIEVITGGEGYDEDADLAARLLAEFPYLAVSVDEYASGTIGAADFDAVVRRALIERLDLA